MLPHTELLCNPDRKKLFLLFHQIDAKKPQCCSAQKCSERASLSETRGPRVRSEELTPSVGSEVARCSAVIKSRHHHKGSSSVESKAKVFCCCSQGMVVPEGLRNKAEEVNFWTPNHDWVLPTRQQLQAVLILKP